MTDFILNKKIIQDAGACMRMGYHRVEDRRKGSYTWTESAVSRLRISFGEQVGELVRSEFPDGFLIEGENFDESLRLTREAIDRGEKVIFEGAFFENRIRIRANILIRLHKGAWRLWEVKAASNADKYMEDLAVQSLVLEAAGIPVTPGLIILDKEANIDSPTFFRRIPLEAEVDRILPELRRRIGILEQHALDGAKPDVPMKRMCGRCDYRDRCWPDLPEWNVFGLYQGDGGWHLVEKLVQQGHLDLLDLPPGTSLRPVQKRQIRALRSGKPVFSGSPRKELERLVVYPLFFLDFEAIAPPIPEYEEQTPYDVIPFQWSCHVQREAGGEIKHREFLWEGGSDPRRPLAESLLELLGNEGSIIVYSDYERRVLNRLGQVLPDLAHELRAIAGRLVDLLRIVVKHYYHPGFRGSFSIKNVLPVFSPELSYHHLAISDGMEAVVAYHELRSPGTSEERRRQIAVDLREYCRQDTRAMVDIYLELIKERADHE